MQHIINHHFLVSISIGVGRRITKGRGISQGGGTNNCRLDHSGGGIRHWSCYSKWSPDNSGGGIGSGGGISHRGGSSQNWSLEGDLVCVSVGGGNGGGDCSLDYCWSGGISYGGGSI
jgi:hypothetical protein